MTAESWRREVTVLMASARAMLERRRSRRVSIRIALKVAAYSSLEAPLDKRAEAIDVSRCGALLRVPFCPTPGSSIKVLNDRSSEIREFRVVRVGEPGRDGLFELGVEILFPTNGFWGI